MLSLSNANLANFVLLLQIDDEFVLPFDDGLIFINHLLGLLRLTLVLCVHICAHVTESRELLVQTSDLIVFNDHQLLQFLDFFLSVTSLPLVTFEHREQTIDTLVACLAKITDDLLAHLHLLLVLFKLCRDFL